MTSQHHRLQRGNRSVFNGAHFLSRLSHDGGQLRQTVTYPRRHVNTGADRQAHFLTVAIHQPAKRCSHMRIRRSDRSVDRFITGGCPPVKRRVPRAAEQCARLAHKRRVSRLGRIERSHKVGIGLLSGPFQIQCLGHAPQAGNVTVGCRRHDTQNTDPCPAHHVSRTHAGQKRDLSIPFFNGQRRAVRQLELAVVALLNFLLRRVHRDTAAFDFTLLTSLTDVSQVVNKVSWNHIRQVALAVDCALNTVVVQLCPRTDHGPLHVRFHHVAVIVQVNGPQARGAIGIRNK